jgi:hypothetical protein
MEDRKRPASGAVDDYAPPSKRQAVNGSSKSKDDSGDMKEEAWIEVSVTRPSLCRPSVIVILQILLPGRAEAAVTPMPVVLSRKQQAANANDFAAFPDLDRG